MKEEGKVNMSKTNSAKAAPSKLKTASKKKTFFLFTMVLPGAIWLVLLRYLPMIGIVIAFKDYKAYPKAPNLFNNIIHSKWSGFKNFKFLIASHDTPIMIRNTLLYNIVFIILGLIISVAFAIMLNEITKKFVAKTYQTLMFFPYFMSWVVASYFVYAFLSPTSGLLPSIQEAMGVPKKEIIDWYNNPAPWPIILVICNIWKNVGYSTVLYLSAITGIDATQYEAANIDGATKWQQVRYITLPNLKTMILILFIMNVGKIFNSDFGLFYQVPMASGLLTPATQVIDTYVYGAMIATGSVGMSTAAGLIQNVLGFICIMVANTIVKKIDDDSALF